VARDGDSVRLLTRNGRDWSGGFPWIVESALKNRHRQFVIDGEAIILGALPETVSAQVARGFSGLRSLHNTRHRSARF
jgi:ATP-dependent DNA ligase